MDNEFTIGLTGIFILWMFYLTYKDNSSFNESQKNNTKVAHKDYKSIIVSIGVLGTFTGIIIGLWHFDTTSIKDSVPQLLEGLKTAFITSVAGMFLSIVLSMVQKAKGHGEAEDELAALISIDNKMHLLDSLEKLNKLDALKHLETLPLMNTKLDSIDTNIKVLSSDISSVKEELRINQTQLFEFLEKSLLDISHSLDDALNKLAEGANKEIIKALENVIQDFNNNLTTTFGKNFEQLNEAVKAMIVWQDNYKGSVESMEESLKSTLSQNQDANTLMIENIEKSNQSAINNLTDSVSITKESNKATQDVLEKASEQARKAFQEIESVSTSIVNMSDKYERIAEVSSKLEVVINTNENQINNLETHLESLKSLGEDAKGVVTSVEDFSKNIQGSLTQQAQVVTELTSSVSDELKQAREDRAKSTSELNEALTSMVRQFISEYQVFIDNAVNVARAVNKVA
ncbi:MAG: hypothetical protein DRG78_22085 [Epsilonproteobacteria bacterium]|nr:MAG: hypothetical protein DRG78_22085 [Campylobacterota bacterium]